MALGSPGRVVGKLLVTFASQSAESKQGIQVARLACQVTRPVCGKPQEMSEMIGEVQPGFGIGGNAVRSERFRFPDLHVETEKQKPFPARTKVGSTMTARERLIDFAKRKSGTPLLMSTKNAIITIMTSHFSAYQPVVFTRAKYKMFQRQHPSVFVVDAFSRQIKELFLINHPHLASGDKKITYQGDEFKLYTRKKESSYIYVYYPWNNHLVKTVGAKDYFRLKTNRNRDLITLEEQEKLASYRVAVLGMSVGSNIAFILTQAGISRNIVLSDFDELDATNLNRIFGGAHQIGLNKCVLAARRIYEDNPFAKVTILPKGITEKNLRPLLERKKINCIIDEIDNIPMKITVRRLAMRYKVPVLMVTDNGDGIVLHIERYDLGYRKIFHKNIEYWNRKLELFTREKGGEKKIAGGIIMDDIVGGVHLVDPTMLRSVKKVLNGKLVSWSQLGSAAMLGGVYTTYAFKRIILGKEKRKEVRVHINPHF